MSCSLPRLDRWASLIAVGALAVVGCGEEPQKTSRRGGRGGPAPAAAPDPIEDDADDDISDETDPASASFDYKEIINGRDPFRSYLREFVQTAADDDGPASDQPKTPLEMFDLSDLRPIAIITGTPVPKAMVREPGGDGLMVTPGSKIGRNGGKVIRITSNRIVVRTIDEELGEPKETILKLQEGDDEGYRLNVVRHDLENDDEKKAEEGASVLAGLDELIRAAQRSQPAAATDGAAQAGSTTPVEAPPGTGTQ